MLLTLVVRNEKEAILYVQSPFRSILFFALYYFWKIFEITQIPKVLRKMGWIGPKLTDKEWLLKYPYLWGRGRSYPPDTVFTDGRESEAMKKISNYLIGHARRYW